MTFSGIFCLLLAIIGFGAPALAQADPGDEKAKEDCGLLERVVDYKDAVTEAIQAHKFTDQEKVIAAGVITNLSAEVVAAVGSKFATDAATKSAFGLVSKFGRGAGIASIIIAILLDAKPANAATLTGAVYEKPSMILQFPPKQGCGIIQMSEPEERERIHAYLTKLKSRLEETLRGSEKVEAETFVCKQVPRYFTPLPQSIAPASRSVAN